MSGNPGRGRASSALRRTSSGGRKAGGQVGASGHLPERSAAIRVVADPDHPDIDVRVDLHDDAIVELRRVLEEFMLYEAFYRDRGRDSSTAMTQDEFVASLGGNCAAQARSSAR